jgi:hypothetical protein
MGSWGSITFGSYDSGHFKSQIPLETLLLFTQDDLVIENETDDGDDYVRRKYSFDTDAVTARRRLDSRGLDLNMCRWLYDQFRSDRVRLINPTDDKSEHIENTLSFDRYLDAMRAINQQQASSTGTVAETAIDDEDADLEILSGIGFFHSDVERYYDDILGCGSAAEARQ